MATSNDDLTLGERTNKALTDLADLIKKARSLDELDSLLDKQRKLAQTLESLIDGKLVSTLPEYKKATAALKSANAAADAAKADMDKVATYIKRIARAISLLGKLAS